MKEIYRPEELNVQTSEATLDFGFRLQFYQQQTLCEPGKSHVAAFLPINEKIIDDNCICIIVVV